MARRSKVSGLPTEVLDDLNSQLVQRGFSGYEELAAWLKSLGFDISKSALHRHGSELEAEFAEAMADARRTRALARAARESGDGEDGALLEAASEIIQDKLIRASMQLKNADGDPADTAKTLSLISRAFSDLGRFEIQRQKWATEVREKVNAKLVSMEQQAVGGGKAGFDLATLKRVREEIYGIM